VEVWQPWATTPAAGVCLYNTSRGSLPLCRKKIDWSKKSFAAFDQASTLIARIELSRSSWFVAGDGAGHRAASIKES
jgi:hypothetical protein